MLCAKITLIFFFINNFNKKECVKANTSFLKRNLESKGSKKSLYTLLCQYGPTTRLIPNTAYSQTSAKLLNLSQYIEI